MAQLAHLSNQIGKQPGGASGDEAHVTGGLVYQGTVVDNNKLGGSSSVFYSSQAVNAAQSLARYTLSWWRER